MHKGRGFPGSSAGKESTFNAGDPGLISWVRKFPWKRDWLPTPVFLGFPGGSVGKKIHLQCGKPGFNPWVGKIPWRRERLPTPVFLGFPGDSAGKESACNAGDPGSNPGLGRSQYSGKENPMDCIAKSGTQLSNFSLLIGFQILSRHFNLDDLLI